MMTVCAIADVLSGWNYLKVTDGDKVYYSNEDGYVPIPDAVNDAEVIGLAIKENTLVVEIEELEDEDETEEE